MSQYLSIPVHARTLATTTVDNHSEMPLDVDALARDLQARLDTLANQGYELVSVLPITKGHFRYEYSCSYGFGVTAGAIIIAQRSRAP